MSETQMKCIFQSLQVTKLIIIFDFQQLIKLDAKRDTFGKAPKWTECIAQLLDQIAYADNQNKWSAQ